MLYFDTFGRLVQKELCWGGSSENFYRVTVLDEENDIVEDYAMSVSGEIMFNF